MHVNQFNLSSCFSLDIPYLPSLSSSSCSVTPFANLSTWTSANRNTGIKNNRCQKLKWGWWKCINRSERRPISILISRAACWFILIQDNNCSWIAHRIIIIPLICFTARRLFWDETELEVHNIFERIRRPPMDKSFWSRLASPLLLRFTSSRLLTRFLGRAKNSFATKPISHFPFPMPNLLKIANRNVRSSMILSQSVVNSGPNRFTGWTRIGWITHLSTNGQRISAGIHPWERKTKPHEFFFLLIIFTHVNCTMLANARSWPWHFLLSLCRSFMIQNTKLKIKTIYRILPPNVEI